MGLSFNFFVCSLGIWNVAMRSKKRGIPNPSTIPASNVSRTLPMISSNIIMDKKISYNI